MTELGMSMQEAAALVSPERYSSFWNLMENKRLADLAIKTFTQSSCSDLLDRLIYPTTEKEHVLACELLYSDARWPFGILAELHARAPNRLDEMAMTLKSVAWKWHWAREGFSIFCLDEGILTQLILTEMPSDGTLKELEYPFGAFRIRIPKGFVQVKDEEHEYWIHYLDVAHIDGQVLVVMGLDEADLTILVRDPGGAMLYGCCLLPDDETLDSFLDPQVTIGGSSAPIALMDKIVVNFLLMLKYRTLIPVCTSPESMKRGQKRGRPNKFVFPHKKVSFQLMQAAKEEASGRFGSSKAGWELKQGHRVMGHWKSQRFGKGRAFSKRIHVEAYWRGPDEGEGVLHQYQPRKKREKKKKKEDECPTK